MTPDIALSTLLAGNERFAKDRSLHPDRTSERRQETAQIQEPFAIILGCSDSRVAPEIIFDQGIGDLFIIRVAGNVVGKIELESINFSALYLHSSLIVVLGHENCGAVNAVMHGDTHDIETVASLIKPAVSKTQDLPGDWLENAIKENVKMVVAQLRKTAVISELMAQKKIDVVGGLYNFHTGRIELV